MASTVFAFFPGKHLYMLTSFTLTFIRLPFWLTYYISASNRPHPKWTYKQALRIRLIKSLMDVISTTQAATKLTLLPGKEGSRFAILNPAPSTHYQGITTSNPSITPSPIGGTWHPHPPPPTLANEDVILHFHGGAFVIGDGRTHDTGFAAQTFLTNTTAKYIFTPQYRLSSTPTTRFPAALQDAITSLHYLTSTLQIPAKNIVVSGDSAGGNIVLALLRYIHDTPSSGLPHPGCAWLWSPWINPGAALIPGAYARSAQAATDFLNGDLGAWGVESFRPLASTGVSLQDAYISFLGRAFQSATPLFFSTGECEVLFDDDVRAYEEFVAAGNTAELSVEEGAVHDIILVGDKMGFEGEAGRSARRAGEFWARNR